MCSSDLILAPIIRPVLGGWITDNWTWPWIFYINVPFGCIAALLSKKLIEDPPYAKRQHNVKIDGKGFFYLTIWLVTLQTVFDKLLNSSFIINHKDRRHFVASFSCPF